MKAQEPNPLFVRELYTIRGGDFLGPPEPSRLGRLARNKELVKINMLTGQAIFE